MSIFSRLQDAGKALIGPAPKSLVSYRGKSAITTQPATWTPSNVSFGPGEPIRPSSPKETPRREQYGVSRNIMWTPRSEEPRFVTYSQMRSLSRLSGVLRTVIEKRKDEIKGLDYEISVKPEYENDVADPRQEVREVTKFFEKPDLETPFDQWENAILEDIYVVDAPALYKERDRLGRFRSLQTIDGTTFKVLVNDSGRVPNPPELAYEQIIYGMPHTGYVKPIRGLNPYITPQRILATNLGRDVYTNYEELFYRPYNLSSDGVYGYSHVESIIMTIEISLRRDVSMKEWFKSGNVPAGFMPVPDTWSPDQIIQFQNDFNLALAGDLANRSQLVAFPGVGTVQIINPLTFDSVFDQWLARIICARFGESPIPYVSQINRAVGEEMEEASRDEGLVPMMQYLAQWYNDIIDNCLEKPYIQFKWNPGQNYGKEDAAMDVMLQEHGGMTIDDLRMKTGKKPLENGLGAVPMILNSGSWVKIEDVINGTVPGQNQQSPWDAEGQQNDMSQFQLSLKAQKDELDDWQKFAINRLGKKTARTFEIKDIPSAVAADIQKAITKADTTEMVKAVFENERQKLDRQKPPAVDSTIVKLEQDYRDDLTRKMNGILKDSMKFDEADHPRAASGTTTGGQFVAEGEGGTPSEKKPAKPDKKPAAEKPKVNPRADRARTSYNPATVEKQRTAESNELMLAKGVNGKRTTDNEAFDVICGRSAVEVKTIIGGKNDKITMHPESLKRKLDMAKKEKMRPYTVVFDARKDIVYYKQGLGSFRLANMKVTTVDKLREILV